MTREEFLEAELADARWQVRIRDEMLRIISGGDKELVAAICKQAVEAEIADGSIHDNLAS